jgi:sphingolipid delta-4 desaturase
MSSLDYTYVDYPQPHVERAKAILQAHPDVRALMGPYLGSVVWIVGLVALQLGLAYLFRASPYWLIVPVAYLVGAFANHALYVMIHECSHNLVLRGNRANRWLGMLCDLPLVFPGAMGFRKFHLLHHRYLGEYDLDPDLVSRREGRAVGNRSWRKALWLALFFVSQGLLVPLRMKQVRFWDRWILINLLIQIGVVAAVLLLAGPRALLYLVLSTVFALGLHPLGGRWIQEHYVSRAPQETYSYYGPLNRLAFNMGYHNEHHDLPHVAWKRLPEIQRMAPEFYEPLHAYRSWSAVVWDFITNRRMSPFSRIIHPSTARSRSGANDSR